MTTLLTALTAVSATLTTHIDLHISQILSMCLMYLPIFHILTFPAKKNVEAMTNPGSAFAVTRMACTLSRPTRPSSWPGPEATLRTCWWSFVIIRHVRQCNLSMVPVVTHKAVAEVSKIGNL